MYAQENAINQCLVIQVSGKITDNNCLYLQTDTILHAAAHKTQHAFL